MNDIICKIVFTRELWKLSWGFFTPIFRWIFFSRGSLLTKSWKQVKSCYDTYNGDRMEVAIRFCSRRHKSVTRRLIRGSIRVRLARYESNVQCETMVQWLFAFSVPRYKFGQWIAAGKPCPIFGCVIQAIADERKFYDGKAIDLGLHYSAAILVS